VVCVEVDEMLASTEDLRFGAEQMSVDQLLWLVDWGMQWSDHSVKKSDIHEL